MVFYTGVVTTAVYLIGLFGLSHVASVSRDTIQAELAAGDELKLTNRLNHTSSFLSSLCIKHDHKLASSCMVLCQDLCVSFFSGTPQTSSSPSFASAEQARISTNNTCGPVVARERENEMIPGQYSEPNSASTFWVSRKRPESHECAMRRAEFTSGHRGGPRRMLLSSPSLSPFGGLWTRAKHAWNGWSVRSSEQTPWWKTVLGYTDAALRDADQTGAPGSRSPLEPAIVPPTARPTLHPRGRNTDTELCGVDPQSTRDSASLAPDSGAVRSGMAANATAAAVVQWYAMFDGCEGLVRMPTCECLTRGPINYDRPVSQPVLSVYDWLTGVVSPDVGQSFREQGQDRDNNQFDRNTLKSLFAGANASVLGCESSPLLLDELNMFPGADTRPLHQHSLLSARDAVQGSAYVCTSAAVRFLRECVRALPGITSFSNVTGYCTSDHVQAESIPACLLLDLGDVRNLVTLAFDWATVDRRMLVIEDEATKQSCVAPDYVPEMRWMGSLETSVPTTEPASQNEWQFSGRSPPIGRRIPIDVHEEARGLYGYFSTPHGESADASILPDDDPVWATGGTYDLDWIVRVHNRASATSVPLAPSHDAPAISARVRVSVHHDEEGDLLSSGACVPSPGTNTSALHRSELLVLSDGVVLRDLFNFSVAPVVHRDDAVYRNMHQSGWWYRQMDGVVLRWTIPAWLAGKRIRIRLAMDDGCATHAWSRPVWIGRTRFVTQGFGMGWAGQSTPGDHFFSMPAAKHAWQFGALSVVGVAGSGRASWFRETDTAVATVNACGSHPYSPRWDCPLQPSSHIVYGFIDKAPTLRQLPEPGIPGALWYGQSPPLKWSRGSYALGSIDRAEADGFVFDWTVSLQMHDARHPMGQGRRWVGLHYHRYTLELDSHGSDTKQTDIFDADYCALGGVLFEGMGDDDSGGCSVEPVHVHGIDLFTTPDYVNPPPVDGNAQVLSGHAVHTRRWRLSGSKSRGLARQSCSANCFRWLDSSQSVHLGTSSRVWSSAREHEGDGNMRVHSTHASPRGSDSHERPSFQWRFCALGSVQFTGGADGWYDHVDCRVYGPHTGGNWSKSFALYADAGGDGSARATCQMNCFR